MELAELSELQELGNFSRRFNLTLKIIKLSPPNMDYRYNEYIRSAVLADRSGAVNAKFIGVGNGLQVADVIYITGAKIIQDNNSKYELIIENEPELLSDDIPVIDENMIFDSSEYEDENEIRNKYQDIEFIELKEMKTESKRYNVKVQIISGPNIEQKYFLGKYDKFVEFIVGDNTGCMPLVFNDLNAIKLKPYDEIELYGAILGYRSCPTGSELYLMIEDFKSQVELIATHKDLYVSLERITHIESELNFIEEIDELKRNIHLKCKIISIDPPRKIKIQGEEIDYAIARIGDQTGTFLLKLWGNDAVKFLPGDKIQILSANVTIDKHLERKILEIDDKGIIRYTYDLPDNFVINDKDYSELTQDELEELYDSFEYINIDELEFDNIRRNYIVKILECYPPIYLMDKKRANSYKLERFLVGDSTGCVYLSLINNKISIKCDDVVRLLGFYARARGRDIYLETDSFGKVKILQNDSINEVSDEILFIEGEFTPINELKPTGNYNIKATVLNITPEYTFKNKDGSEHKFVYAKLEDQSGSIDLVLFDDQINKIINMTGCTVEIYDCFLSTYKSKTQLKLGKYGDIKISSQN